MDTKRTQRILGILVIIALVLILFPLMFGKNDAHTQITTTAEPPFPEQQQPTSATVAESNQEANNSLPADPSEPNPTATVKPNKSNTATSAPISDIQTQNDAEISPAIALEVNNKVTPEVQALKTAKPDETISIDSENRVSIEEPVIPVVNQKAIKSISLSKKQVTAKAKALSASNHENLVNLNSKAWAVQMGSFKNKENARVLADRLRSAGFKAFTKEVKSAKGSTQVRVYIGPEFKQASAIKLSADIEKVMNMQGVVIAYKPLAL